ncbi:tyrosine-type recombinase/integrase [Acholeplasma hippikon]|uniref:Tyrosine recombinase XerD n=1 Tax=Acholeplasma hippikon TaxID=264636 RepID=A0A449BL30_9MOLU|nr:site-specific integrase [Acholeplasma hippikon]VEU83149.1 Tyrosine recombinase XerD [Acholeplasma hippikon]VEU83354.1 Tyrosine recombinase XerD [Acholeplasma hippikon]
MTIKELTEKHLNKIALELSKGTYEHYKSHYQHLVSWCEKNEVINVEDLTESKLTKYIFEMKEVCSNRTINMRIGNLQRCYRAFGIEFEYLQRIPKLKQRLVTYDYIELADIRRMRKYFYSLPMTERNIYEAAVFLILMETGCRRTELINIEKKNIDFEYNLIKFTKTKTFEDRIVPFKEKTAPIIQELCKMNTDKYLFVNPNTNKQMTKSDLENLMRKYKRKFNFEKFHAHMFRHSFATIMIDSGVDRKTLQRMTGHSDGKSLDRYIHIRQSKIMSDYKDKFLID